MLGAILDFTATHFAPPGPGHAGHAASDEENSQW
jgi:hypothetical protein